MLEFIIWFTVGVVVGVPVALLLLFALTRPPRETVRTEYVYRVNGEIVGPLSDADEERLAANIEKAEALYRESKTPR